MRAFLFSASLFLFLFTLQPIPAPHITTWDSISFKADALKQSYKGAKCCGNAAGCSVDVPLSTSTVNAPQHGLETHKFWENVNGLWEGELSYSRNSPDKAFPGDYKNYEGLIWRQARGDKYFQKNIFFYKHDPNWGVTEAMCRSNNSIALQRCEKENSGGIIGKKLDFGYGFFTCDGSAGAVKIFSEVHSKQSLDGVSLVPDASIQTSRSYCGDTDQFTAALEGGDTALAACGSTTTFGSVAGQTIRYSHGQIIAINERSGTNVDNEMYRAWLDTAGSHSYYKERRVATTLSSSPDATKRVATLIRDKLKDAGFSGAVREKILREITGGSTSNLDNEITNWFGGAVRGHSLDVCSTSAQAKCL